MQRGIVHPKMRGAGRMNHQTPAIPHVGEMAKDLQIFDERLSLLAGATQIKTKDRTGAAREQTLRKFVATMVRPARMSDPFHHRMVRQKVHNRMGITDVTRHPKRQSLNPLQYQPCRMRAHARAKVSQALATGSEQKCANRVLFTKHHAMKAWVGLCQFAKFAGTLPIKRTTVDQQSADHRAMS